MFKKHPYYLLFFLLNMLAVSLFSQNKKDNLYHPEADATVQIRAAIEQAAAEDKHVFLQVGGNWCGWCIKFHQFCKNDRELDSLISANYVVVHVNHSRENENKDILTSLGFPQRFGFPVFVILDSEGKRIHTQDSGLLEEAGSYDVKLVARFFQSWTPKAIDPDHYK